MKDKTLYSVIHNHNYGSSNYLVRCSHFPTEEEVIEHCNIDYEPNRGETIDIADVNLAEIIDIP